MAKKIALKMEDDIIPRLPGSLNQFRGQDRTKTENNMMKNVIFEGQLNMK